MIFEDTCALGETRISWETRWLCADRERDQHFRQLDVLSDNPAVGFYRAVGLELLAETTAPKPAAFGVPPEYRMGMRLKRFRFAAKCG